MTRTPYTDTLTGSGNVEPANTAVVNVDNVAPTITHIVGPAANAAGWNNTNPTVHWIATDDSGGSGIAYVSPDQTLTTETTGTTLTGTARDTAGNTATDPVLLKLDKAAPTITASVTGPKNPAGVYVGAVTVSFTCADAGGSGLVSCPSPTVLTDPGPNQSVLGTAEDAAGNRSVVLAGGITIAPTRPSITVTTPGNAKIRTANGDQVMGTVTSSGTIAKVVATYTPQGAARTPVVIEGTATIVSTTDGVTTYAWRVNAPTTVNGRMSVAIAITDSYGQTSTSTPTSIVVT